MRAQAGAMKAPIQAQLSGLQQQAVFKQQEIDDTRAQRVAAGKSQRASQDAARNARRGTVIDPKTGKAFKHQRLMKFAAGVGKFGLPLAMAGPMVGGALAQAMYSGDTEADRLGRAEFKGQERQFR